MVSLTPRSAPLTTVADERYWCGAAASRRPVRHRGVVLRHANDRPTSMALRDEVASFTYQELAERVGAMASGLGALSVAPGDRVALYLGNSAEFVVLALACLWLGHRSCLSRWDSPASRLAGIIADCDPLWCHRRTGRPCPASAGRAHGDGGGGHRRLVPLRSPLDRPGERRLPYIHLGHDRAAKGVRVGERAFRWSVCRCAEAVGLDETTRGLAVSPFHFDGSYGLVFPVLVAGAHWSSPDERTPCS